MSPVCSSAKRDGADVGLGGRDPAGQWDAFWQKRSQRPLGRLIAWVRGRAVTPALVRFVGRMVPPGHVIEAGCGSAGVSLALAGRRGDRLTLVDVSPEALDMARANAAVLGVDAATVQCDIEQLSMHVCRTADSIVYNIGVVEHFPDVDGVLREMAAVSGRYALAVIPERTLFWQVFVWASTLLRLVPPDFWIHLYDACEFRRAVEEAGLEVLRVDRTRLFGMISYLGVSFRRQRESPENCHGQ